MTKAVKVFTLFEAVLCSGRRLQDICSAQGTPNVFKGGGSVLCIILYTNCIFEYITLLPKHNLSCWPGTRYFFSTYSARVLGNPRWSENMVLAKAAPLSPDFSGVFRAVSVSLITGVKCDLTEPSLVFCYPSETH